MEENKTGISRRGFLKTAAVGTAAVAGMSVLAGCSKSAEATAPTLPAALDAAEFEKSSVVIEPITKWDSEKTYDVVIVGAGAAGCGAALQAKFKGLSVCVLQKQKTAISQGGGPNGIVFEDSDPKAIQAFLGDIMRDDDWRANLEQFMQYLKYSGAALKLASDAAKEIEDKKITFTYTDKVGTYAKTGYKWHTLALSFGPKPISNSDGVIGLSQVLAKRGVEYFYETPGVQLVKDNGKVTAIIGKSADGKYIRFNASKGVILTTGDYQNNDAMVQKYCPDAAAFQKKQANKTGDGHLMAIMAGAVMEPLTHCKMIHDADSGPMRDTPFMGVNNDGLRFMDEAAVPYEHKNNILRNHKPAGRYTQVFDSDYFAQVTKWGNVSWSPNSGPVTLDALNNYIKGAVTDPKGVYTVLIDTYTAGTLEELGKKLEITDIPAFVKSVARYNELCDKGVDSDFGKDPKFMSKIVKAPFYGIRKNYRVSALVSGVLVDKFARVLDEKNAPIPGLYACGNTSGQFYGGQDYPFTMGGLSLGRAYTQGYIAALHAGGGIS